MMDDPGTLEDCRRWLKAATSNPDVQVKSEKVFLILKMLEFKW